MIDKMTPEQEDALRDLQGMRERVEKAFPNSRERSLSLTRLQEGVLWLTVAPTKEPPK